MSMVYEAGNELAIKRFGKEYDALNQQNEINALFDRVVSGKPIRKIKRRYTYYGSNSPLDLNRASEEGVIWAKNINQAKNILKKRFKYFLIFRRKGYKYIIQYQRKGRVY